METQGRPDHSGPECHVKAHGFFSWAPRGDMTAQRRGIQMGLQHLPLGPMAVDRNEMFYIPDFWNILRVAHEAERNA